MKSQFHYRGILSSILGLLLIFSAKVQGQIPSATVTWNFSDFLGYSNGISSFSIAPDHTIPSQFGNGIFPLQRPYFFNLFNYPGITNGSFTTNIAVGQAYDIQISDGYYNTRWTNYFGTNDTGTFVNGWNRRGYPSGPNFVYLSPIVTNININFAGAASIVTSSNGAITVTAYINGGVTTYDISQVLSCLSTNQWNAFTSGAPTLVLSGYLPLATYAAGFGGLPTNSFVATVNYQSGFGGLPTNSFLSISAWLATYGGLPTNSWIAQAAYNSSWGNLPTNSFVPVTGAGAFVPSQNGIATNLMAPTTFGAGNGVIYYGSTNVIAITNGLAAGIYQYYPAVNIYTNLVNPAWTILFANPSWLVQSNGVAWYSSATLEGTYNIVPTFPSPAPIVFHTGYKVEPWIVLGNTAWNTNLMSLINAAASSAQTSAQLNSLTTNAWNTFTNGFQAGAQTLAAYLPVAVYNQGFGNLPTNSFVSTVVYNLAWGSQPTNGFVGSNTWTSSWGALPTNSFPSTAIYNAAWGNLPTNSFVSSVNYGNAWGAQPTNGFVGSNTWTSSWGNLTTNSFPSLAAYLAGFGNLPTNSYLSITAWLNSYGNMPTNSWVSQTTYNAAWGNLPTNSYVSLAAYLAGTAGGLPTNSWVAVTTYNAAWGNLPTNSFLNLTTWLATYGNLPTNSWVPQATYNAAWGNLPTNSYVSLAAYLAGTAGGLPTNSWVAAVNGQATNLMAPITFGAANGIIYYGSTNVMVITNGLAVGIYQYYTTPNIYTNLNDNRWTIQFVNPAWIVQSNGNSWYSSSLLESSYTIVGSAPNPVPIVFHTGYKVEPWIVLGNTTWNTNLFSVITNQEALAESRSLSTNAWNTFTNGVTGAANFNLTGYLPITVYNQGFGNLSTNSFVSTVIYNLAWGNLPTNSFVATASYGAAWGNLPTNSFPSEAAYLAGFGGLPTNSYVSLAAWNLTYGNLPTNSWVATALYNAAWGNLATNSFVSTVGYNNAWGSQLTNGYVNSNTWVFTWGNLSTNSFLSTAAWLASFGNLPTNSYVPSATYAAAWGAQPTNGFDPANSAFNATNVNGSASGNSSYVQTNRFTASKNGFTTNLTVITGIIFPGGSIDGSGDLSTLGFGSFNGNGTFGGALRSQLNTEDDASGNSLIAGKLDFPGGNALGSIDPPGAIYSVIYSGAGTNGYLPSLSGQYLNAGSVTNLGGTTGLAALSPTTLGAMTNAITNVASIYALTNGGTLWNETLKYQSWFGGNRYQQETNEDLGFTNWPVVNGFTNADFVQATPNLWFLTNSPTFTVVSNGLVCSLLSNGVTIANATSLTGPWTMQAPGTGIAGGSYIGMKVEETGVRHVGTMDIKWPFFENPPSDPSGAYPLASNIALRASLIPNATNSLQLGGSAATNIFPGISANNLNAANFGATVNGTIYNNISVTNIYLYCPNGNWTSADIGKGIIVNHTGVNGRYFFTSISNVYSPTQIGLSNSVTLAITNLGYCETYTHASAQTNYIVGQTMFNNCSNNLGGNIFWPPPIWYSYFMGTTNVGNTYVIEGPFQNTNQNNAMWIIPPLGGATTPSSKAVVTMNGSDWGVWGTSSGGGNNGSYVNIPPNATVLTIAETGNHFAGTNGCGPSFIDGRAFANPQGFSDNHLFHSGNSIPENTCQLRVNHIGFMESWDSGFCTLNYLGFTDGSGGSWVNVVGGAPSDNYYYLQGQYPSDTNGWAICGSGNNMGNELPMDNVYVCGQYIGLEVGILDVTECTIQNCSNAVDASISPGVYDKLDIQLGGCFNGLTTQPCVDGLGGPSLLRLVFNDCGENTLPSGVRFHAINDQYWSRTSNDGFVNSSGTITVYTNFNNGSTPPPDFIWKFTANNPNISDYNVYVIGALGQINMINGQENKGYEVVTNFTVPAGGNPTFKATANFTTGGDSIRVNAGSSCAEINFGGNSMVFGFNIPGSFTYSFANLQANALGILNAPFGTAFVGPAFNPDGTFVCPTNAYFNKGIFVAGGSTNATITTIGTHTPGQVTVGASPFTFVNPQPFNLECNFSGSVAYSISKNGVGIYGSLAGDAYVMLQTNCSITITYATPPTLYTNAW